MEVLVVSVNIFQSNDQELGHNRHSRDISAHVLRIFLYAATENMAALLRSARLLKISPSGFLQITGTKRNGALTRLCSGAIVSRRTGVCSRQIKPVLDRYGASR